MEFQDAVDYEGRDVSGHPTQFGCVYEVWSLCLHRETSMRGFIR